MRNTNPKIIMKDLDQLLHDSLSAASRKESNYAPIVAFNMLGDYFQAAISQQRRITRKDTSLFRDIHFYLICCDMIRKLSNKLKNLKRSDTKTNLFPSIGCLLKQYKSAQNDYKVARDYLEHIDERLPGDEKRGKMNKPNEISFLKGNVLSLGGHDVDVGKSSLQKLKYFVTEFKWTLLDDCCAYLNIHSPSDLNRIIQRWQRNRETQRLTKKVIKDLKKIGTVV